MRSGRFRQGCGRRAEGGRSETMHPIDLVDGKHRVFFGARNHQQTRQIVTRAIVARGGGGFETQQMRERHAHQQFALHIHHAQHRAMLPMRQRMNRACLHDAFENWRRQRKPFIADTKNEERFAWALHSLLMSRRAANVVPGQIH
jgi:shikimate kinase